MNAVGKRISLIICLLVLPPAHGADNPQPCEKVSVGAIRWDAWHGGDSRPGKAVEISLGQKIWKDRWPEFYSFRDDGIEFDGSRAEVVDREMRLAKKSGIDFWAFVFYGADSPMGRVLRRFMESDAPGPSFALVIEFGRLFGEGAEKFAAEARATMRHPRYLLDGFGRPQVFIMIPPEPLPAAMIERGFERLRSGELVAQQPTFIVMSDVAKEAARVAKEVGSDMISTYAWHDNPQGAPYSALALGTQAKWDRQARFGARVVPVVMSGWDPRPRIDNPVPWGGAYPKGAYYQMATPAELTAHLRSALKWAKHSDHGSCSVLIYAWNEFDEGGWIAPTRGEGTERLKAVERAVSERDCVEVCDQGPMEAGSSSDASKPSRH